MLENKFRHPGLATLAGLAAIAFVIACVAHEALGHGLACLATGGRVTLLSSVFFRCSHSAPVIDAAGPVMSLIFAAIATAALGFVPRQSTVATWLGLIVAYSGFWGAGYLIFSAVTNSGDPGFVLRDLALQPSALWRVGMGIAGYLMYRVILKRALAFVPAGHALLLVYIVVGLVGCASVLFSAGPLLPALREAAQESLLAPVGLLIVALRPSRAAGSNGPRLPPRKPALVVLSVIVIAAFWLTLGRGFASP